MLDGSDVTYPNSCVGFIQSPFNIIPCQQQPGAILGCMDSAACNYDPNATCPDTCSYQTVPWHGAFQNTPQNGGAWYCEAAPCGFGGSATSWPFPSLLDCQQSFTS